MRARYTVRAAAVAAAIAVVAPVAVAVAQNAASAKTADSDSIRARADALIAQMTPEEKAQQVTIRYAFPQLAKFTDRAVEGGAGSLLFVTDAKEANRLQRLAVEKSRLKIPLLFGFDVVHGFNTIFPVPIAMAASWDPRLAEDAQAIAAREARSVGVDWTFAPMVDIARDPRWGRIVEGAGEDPYLGAAMAAAQVRGFQGPSLGTRGHIIAGPKHFVGYGLALGGRDNDEVDISDTQLWNVYLPPFKAAIEAGAGNIMSAYMGVNGVPASGNHWLLTDVLRDKLGFKGFVVSDSGSIGDLRTHGIAADAQGAAAAGLNAGVDMEMTLVQPAYARLPAALAAGQITTARLDEAVRRVLEAKIRMGLFENPYVDEAKVAKVLGAQAHLTAARVAAERSAVLLRNEGNLLPLDRRTLRSVAVIGPLADAGRDTVGPWVFDQNKPQLQSILEGIRSKLGDRVKVVHAPGVILPKRLNASPFAAVVGESKRPEPTDDASGIADAVAAARTADVAILVLGEAQDMIGESASRSTLDLPGRQQELLDAIVATGKPVVVVLASARPLDLKGTKAPAILDIWYPGSRGGDATANLLFGDATPGGKLPFTWPRNIGQLPLIYSHLTSHSPPFAEKRYWNEPNSPVFPFGFGLSYTSFDYSNLKVDKPTIAQGQSVTVSVDVKNTGARPGDEVAQLYIHQRLGSAARPVRELKGFQRVTLKPGETRTLTFRLGPDELRYWNPIRRDWVIENGTFDLAVGTNSQVPFSTTFAVAGN